MQGLRLTISSGPVEGEAGLNEARSRINKLSVVMNKCRPIATDPIAEGVEMIRLLAQDARSGWRLHVAEVLERYLDAQADLHERGVETPEDGRKPLNDSSSERADQVRRAAEDSG